MLKLGVAGTGLVFLLGVAINLAVPRESVHATEAFAAASCQNMMCSGITSCIANVSHTCHYDPVRFTCTTGWCGGGGGPGGPILEPGG
jgi:hypothetical protein